MKRALGSFSWLRGSPGCPFDFVHLSLLDLRKFAEAKPQQAQLLLRPPHPTPADLAYKWMQCSYTVMTAAAVGGGAPPAIELRGREPADHPHHPVCRGPQKASPTSTSPSTCA